MDVTAPDLLSIFRQKYTKEGWGPRMRLKAGYFTPDEYYEALVAKLVTAGSSWADVGCGRDIFPSNRALARELCSRAGYVLGIDPDPNVLTNPFVHDKYQGCIEDRALEGFFPVTGRFDLITLRMVAEHITEPFDALAQICRLLKPGGRLVIYTTSKWAPMSMAAMLVPFRWHNALKRLIWDSKERDTFPTAYKLNTRKDLKRHACAAGLTEVRYQVLDDCRISAGYRWLHWLELRVWKFLKLCRLRHPETCILAVYERSAGGCRTAC